MTTPVLSAGSGHEKDLQCKFVGKFDSQCQPGEEGNTVSQIMRFTKETNVQFLACKFSKKVTDEKCYVNSRYDSNETLE